MVVTVRPSVEYYAVNTGMETAFAVAGIAVVAGIAGIVWLMVIKIAFLIWEEHCGD